MSEKSKKVLIVDDDDLLRDFYSRVLETQNYTVLTGCNGDEAIDILEEMPTEISLVIADLLMPVRTGWELIEYMKERDHLKDIPIIAITGLAASRNEFEKIKKHCNAVLHKGDFDLKTFMNLVKETTG